MLDVNLLTYIRMLEVLLLQMELFQELTYFTESNKYKYYQNLITESNTGKYVAVFQKIKDNSRNS